VTSQVAGRLAVVDEPDRVLVVREDDPSDWLCAFAKAGDFPAARWARNMARTYNERLELSGPRLAGGGAADDTRPPPQPPRNPLRLDGHW
jgi:hypothetical protein